MKLNILYRRWVFIVLFWALFGFAIWVQLIKTFDVAAASFLLLSLLFVCFIIAHGLSDILLPKALQANKMKTFLIQCFFNVLLLAFLIGFIETIFTQLYADEIFRAKEIKGNVFKAIWTRSYSSIPSAALIIGTACGLRFYIEHHTIEQNHANLQRIHLEAQIKLLQDQINPHLMFNVLNHIHILMQRNVALASDLLIQFSDILRYQLYECNREFVDLEREIKYLKDLVAIEQVRWGDELEVQCQWDIQNPKQHITPLLLVPLIENAFKHVARMPNEKGYIHLSCKQQEKTLELRIENSYSPAYKTPSHSQGLGLTNVRKRLSIQYPDRHQLNIKKTDHRFSLLLQLQLN